MMQNKNKEVLLVLFRKKCKEHGLSMTPQRIAIYKELIVSRDHPSAENIYARIRTFFPDIAIDTVYRTLATFSEIEVVHVVEGYGEAKRYDPDTEPHHHFRCMRCNKIIDIEGNTFGKLNIPHGMKKKYNVSNVKVILEGACDECVGKN
jgi:Fur family peroxide stress response transcriptional regulator